MSKYRIAFKSANTGWGGSEELWGQPAAFLARSAALKTPVWSSGVRRQNSQDRLKQGPSKGADDCMNSILYNVLHCKQLCNESLERQHSKPAATRLGRFFDQAPAPTMIQRIHG